MIVIRSGCCAWTSGGSEDVPEYIARCAQITYCRWLQSYVVVVRRFILAPFHDQSIPGVDRSMSQRCDCQFNNADNAVTDTE